MENKEIKAKIQKIFSKKELTSKQVEYALSLVDKIKDNDIYVYLTKGKIFLGNKKYEEARFYFDKCYELDPDNKSLQYYYYKLNVNEHLFKDAYLNLFRYRELYNYKNINVSLPLTMLEVIMSMEYNYQYFKNSNYEIELTNMYHTSNLANNEILILYHDIIKEFNKRNYIKSKSMLIELSGLIEEKNIPIEVNALIIMIDKIIKLKIQNEKSNLPEEIIKTIYKEIQENEETAKVLLDKYEDKLIKTNNYEFEYLKKVYEDKIKYKNSPKGKKGRITYYKNLGSKYANEGKYKEAKSIYEKALEETKEPIFYYYIGKCEYKNNNYNEAIKYLEKHQELTTYKKENGLLYLIKIYEKTKENKKALKLYKQLLIIEKIKEINFNLKKPSSKSKTPQDKIKNLQSKKLESEIFTFEEAKSVSINNYYNYDLKDKLEVIKQLLKMGKKKTAEKLLKELHGETKEEKQMINSFHKNKKLYQNQ